MDWYKIPKECGKKTFLIFWILLSLQINVWELEKSPKPSIVNPTASLNEEL